MREKSFSSQEAKLRPRVNVVGPFLGASPAGSIRICIGLPHRPDLTNLSCVLSREPNGDNPIDTLEAQSDARYPGYNLFSFVKSELHESAKVYYTFTNSGTTLLLEGGLTPSDCWFFVPGEFNDDDSFIMMSCHNPFMEKNGSAGPGWAMWERLAKLIDSDPSIRLLIMGGDQVYNDDIESEFSSLTGKLQVDDPEKLRARFIRQYQLFWENKNYRRVLARIPSLAMWDDHDITDGWGGRPESFNSEGCFTAPWTAYFAEAHKAFESYQNSRNPERLQNCPEGTFTTQFDFGSNRILLCDFRSEKNSKRRILWSDAQHTAFLTALKNIPEKIRNVFILFPVVALRTNFAGDKRLTTLFKWLFGIVMKVDNDRRIKRLLPWCTLILWILLSLTLLYPHIAPSPPGLCLILALVFLIGVTILTPIWLLIRFPTLPQLTDDMEDGLTSEINIEHFKEMLTALFEVQIHTGRRVVILSGDIHVCGLSEIIRKEGTTVHCIPQIVSSPVAYTPMPKPVEGLTTTTSEMILKEGEVTILGRNITYLSKRNFAQMWPGRIAKGCKYELAFYLEGHTFPICLPIHFIN